MCPDRCTQPILGKSTTIHLAPQLLPLVARSPHPPHCPVLPDEESSLMRDVGKLEGGGVRRRTEREGKVTSGGPRLLWISLADGVEESSLRDTGFIPQLSMGAPGAPKYQLSSTKNSKHALHILHRLSMQPLFIETHLCFLRTR